MTDWHSRTYTESLTALDVDAGGVCSEQAALRRKQYGAGAFTETPLRLLPRGTNRYI